MRHLIEPVRLFVGFFISLLFTSILIMTLAFIWSIFIDVTVLSITSHPATVILFVILLIIHTVCTMIWLFDLE